MRVCVLRVWKKDHILAFSKCMHRMNILRLFIKIYNKAGRFIFHSALKRCAHLQIDLDEFIIIARTTAISCAEECVQKKRISFIASNSVAFFLFEMQTNMLPIAKESHLLHYCVAINRNSKSKWLYESRD